MHRLIRLAALFIVFLGLLPAALAAQGYRVSPGDVLQVEVLEDDTLNRNVLVAPDGSITFPLAGSLNAGGRTLGAIQNDLVARLQPNFAAAPTVFVSLERVAPEDPTLPQVQEEEPVVAIYALGEVGNRGRVELAPGTTLLQAVAQLGGFTEYAARRRLQLRRFDPQQGREVIYPLDYDAIIEGRSPNGRVVMREGDVIFAPTRRLFE